MTSTFLPTIRSGPRPKCTPRGGNVELMPLGPCDHNEVVYRGVARVRAWFADVVEGHRDHPDAAKHH